MIGLLAFDGQSKPDLCISGVRLRRYGGFPRWILDSPRSATTVIAALSRGGAVRDLVSG